MSTRIDSGLGLADVDWPSLERLLARFEAACQGRPWPNIDDYLSERAGADRQTLLIELVHADFELRLRAGEPACAREYLERFPELARDAVAAGELLARDAELHCHEGRENVLQRLGRFELKEKIGEGTFAVVYKAQDTELDRLVAVKIPRQGNHPMAREATRSLREARHVARLRHPGIVPVHEAGMIDGFCYVVSDYIAGTTLADRLAHGAFAAREAARVVARIADALDHAHRQGIIHRDVKPSNILLDLEGNPHVTDFGLAGRVAGDASLSIDGKIRGTPAYMAPEQAHPEKGLVDARSDVYSLGVVLYELLTGEMPFRGSVRMVLLQVVDEDPRPPRRCDESIPRDLETICLKAMAKEPWRRYATAAALAADLRRYLDGRPVQARPVGPAGRFARWCRRRPGVAALAAAALIAVVGMAWEWRRAEINLREVAREHARYRLALASSGQVTGSILKIAAGQEDAGTSGEADLVNLALERMNQQIDMIKDDPDSRPMLAIAYRHASNLEYKYGRRGPARDAMKLSLAAWNEVHVERPNDLHSLYYVATTSCQLAEQFRDDLSDKQRGRLIEEAEALYQKGAMIIRSRNPASNSPRAAWNNRFHDIVRLARVAKKLQRKDDAIAWFNKALDCWNVIHTAGETVDTVDRKNYFVVNAELASLRYATGRPAESIPTFLVIRDLRVEDLRAHPEDALARERLANTYLKLGLARRDSGDAVEALRDFQQARTLWEQSSRNTSLPRLKALSRINTEIGRIEDRAGHFSKAIQWFTRAKDLNELLVARNPADPGSRVALAMCHHVIGNLHRDLGQFAEADRSFRSSLQIRKALVRDFPGNTRYAADLNGTRLKLADAGLGVAGG